jgi:hypothetical protein
VIKLSQATVSYGTTATDRERTVRAAAWLLVGIAAIRVLVFAAVFPFFNNVDEIYHFDLVVKYSHGEVPTRLMPVSPESARYVILYGTPEYINPLQKFPEGRIPPPTWRFPAAEVARAMPLALKRWATEINHESLEPPGYYAVAALWLKLGRLFGIGGGFLLYWIRFLNPLLAGALVWIGFRAASLMFPDRLLLRLGVPALLAFFPQDTFYSIQSDVLSPVLFGLAFLGVVKWLQSETPTMRLALFTGLSLAAVGLVKGANWPLVAVAAGSLMLHSFLLIRRGKQAGVWPATSLLFLCVALPVGGWLMRNAYFLGDLTGTAEKTAALGWTRKPFGDWWRHPIFAPRGLFDFWSETMASFWRGEFVWFGNRLASPAMDVFYWLSSLVLLGVALSGLVWRRKTTTAAERNTMGFALACFAASVAFLALISMAFDYGDCFYPSRVHPFFTSGRLITGSLIPFALLYVYGLGRASALLNSDWPGLLVLGGILFFVTVSEMELNSPVFSSAYNWFGLWAGPLIVRGT